MSPASRRRAFLASLLLVAFSAAVQAAPKHAKIDRSLEQSVRAGASTQNVIITVSDPALRAQIRKSLEAHGDVVKAEHPSIGALTAEIHTEDVSLLANHPGVKFVSADATVSAGAAKSTLVGAGWIGDNLRVTLGLAATAGTGPKGAGIGVAVVDSGLTPNGDFTGRITGFYDLTKTGTPVPTLPYDDFGHGTHISGLIGSSGALSKGKLQGVAPAVNLVGFKVLDGNGQGTTSAVITALEYITANRKMLGVQIVNLSLGHPIFAPAADDPLVQAVDNATAEGLIVVVSAGNFGCNPKTGVVGYGGTTSPGNARTAITVGASVTNNTIERNDDRVASFSSRGPTWYDAFVKPDLVAPGTQLSSDANATSTLFKQLPANQQQDPNKAKFLQLSGTSMAAAVTSGVVALVLEANRNAHYGGATALTPNEVKAIVQFSATPLSDDYGQPYDVFTQGTGEINGIGAISLASAIDTSALNGEWWLRNSVPTSTTFGTHAYLWAQNIVWADNIVWGDMLFHQTIAWAHNIVWGDNIVWADTLAWGALAHVKTSNIVWSHTVLWATNVVWGNNLIGLADGDNIVWGSAADGDNIVWGNLLTDDNIVWGNLFDDNIIWGNTSADGDNVVWGNALFDNDNIVWGNRSLVSRLLGGIF